MGTENLQVGCGGSAPPAAGASESTLRSADSGVWREPGFAVFTAGHSFSQLGVQFSEVAMHVSAVTLLAATEAQMGFLHAAETAAFLLVGLPAGAWLDRMRKRNVMIAADLVRAAAVIAVPILWLTGSLEMWHLFVVGGIVGVGTVFFDVGYQSFVPVLVRDRFVGAANGVLEGTSQTMKLGGPALAGLLIKIVSAPILLAVTAVGFLASAVSLAFVRDLEIVRPKAERQHLVHEIGEGLRFVLSNHFLVRVVITTGVANLGSSIAWTLAPILMLRILGIDEALFGLLISLGALGGLAGSAFATRIARRLGEGRALAIAAVVMSGVFVFTPLSVVFPAIAVPLLAIVQIVGGFSVLVYNVIQVTARQRLCPKPLLGRMNASIRFVVWGVMPIGALLAGWLGTALGTVPAIWIGVVISALGALPLAFSKYARMRELPTREPVA